MIKLNRKRVVIATISLVRSQKVANGGSFLINEGTAQAMWVNINFVKNLFTNKGLSTQTSFQMLCGSTLQYFEGTVTDEMLAQAGGEVLAENPQPGGEPIAFKKPGLKQTGHTLIAMSDKLSDAIFNSGVVFDSGWADIGTVPAAPARPAMPNNDEEPVAKTPETITDKANTPVNSADLGEDPNNATNTANNTPVNFADEIPA